MRHHSTSIVGPDIDGNEQAVWAKMFPYHTTPVKDAPPAHPSVGERSMADRLGEIAFRVEVPRMDYYRWENAVGAVRDSYCNMGLAVRREVLAEPFTDEDVKAADKAFMAFRGGGRTDWIRAALSAALASRVARESKVTP